MNALNPTLLATPRSSLRSVEMKKQRDDASSSPMGSTQQQLDFGASQGAKRPELARLDLVSPFVRLASAMEAKREAPRRVRYYQRAAYLIAAEDIAIREALSAGQDPAKVSGIDPHLATMLIELARSGRIERLERLEQDIHPRARLTLVDGIGPTMADRLLSIGVNDLVALEQAVHDGRLDRVPGFGAHRVDRVRLWLDGRRTDRRVVPRVTQTLSISDILGIDAEFRQQAGVGEAQWSRPMWRREWNGWVVAATRDPQRLDAVIIHANRNGQHLRIVVETEQHGSLAGMRIVRGKQGASRRYHLDQRVAA